MDDAVSGHSDRHLLSGVDAVCRSTEDCLRVICSNSKSALMVDEVANATLGPILVTTKGFTLYRYALDEANKVMCTGSCAITWPPLLLPAGVTIPTGGKGVTALGTVRDPNGKLQVTFKGHPLYTYVGDKKPGSIKGGTVADFSVIQPPVVPLR